MRMPLTSEYPAVALNLLLCVASAWFGPEMANEISRSRAFDHMGILLSVSALSCVSVAIVLVGAKVVKRRESKWFFPSFYKPPALMGQPFQLFLLAGLVFISFGIGGAISWAFMAGSSGWDVPLGSGMSVLVAIWIVVGRSKSCFVDT